MPREKPRSSFRQLLEFLVRYLLSKTQVEVLFHLLVDDTGQLLITGKPFHGSLEAFEGTLTVVR